MQERQTELGLSFDALANAEKQPSQEWKVYLAAIEYIRCGYFVVPIIKNGKKLPRSETGINYGSASSKRKTIDSWFHPDSGKFKGWNIGIATGRTDGVFVMDVDRHGDQDGLLALERLEKEYGQLPDGPVQDTPNNGKHYLFRWQENASQSTGKIAKAIDTRGGDTNSCKGHVVAFPSTINGKMYGWSKFGPLPNIPPWIMEKLGVLWVPTGGKGRGNENVTDEDVERPIEQEQIVRMLVAIDPNDLEYDDWLKIGLSVKSQLPDDVGLHIWDEWSSRGTRYDPKECIIRWKGFSDFGTVRGGTLFYYAKQAGWTPDVKEGDRSGNPFDEVVAQMNEEFAIVTIGGKIRIIKEKDNSDNHMMTHYDLMDKDSFSLLLMNKKIEYGTDKNGVPKKVSIGNLWLGHEGRRTYENGMGLFPDGKVPNGYYNTWNGFSVEPRKGDCSQFLYHIKEVICDGDEENNNFLLDWMADLVQDPANPKGCAVVMRGGEGCGKGTLANTIGSLFGSHHRHLIDDNHLTSNFNSHLFDAIVVFADEITWGGNKKTAGKLKGMITEKYLVGERKGIDAIQYRNMVHLLIASNSEWVIPAGADSRRWFVLNVPNTKANDRAYFMSINDELDNGGREALLYYLINRKITANLRHAPETEALQVQRMLNVQDDQVLNWWMTKLIEGKLRSPDVKDEGLKWPEVVGKTALHLEYEAYCLHRNQRCVNVSVFFKEMSKYGLKQIRPTVDGERVYCIKIPTVKNCIETVERKHGKIMGLDEEDD